MGFPEKKNKSSSRSLVLSRSYFSSIFTRSRKTYNGVQGYGMKEKDEYISFIDPLQINNLEEYLSYAMHFLIFFLNIIYRLDGVN